jgi:hypothetical protein
MLIALLGFLFLIAVLIIVVIALRSLFEVMDIPPAFQRVCWCILAVIVLIIMWNNYGPSLTSLRLPR